MIKPNIITDNLFNYHKIYRIINQYIFSDLFLYRYCAKLKENSLGLRRIIPQLSIEAEYKLISSRIKEALLKSQEKAEK